MKNIHELPPVGAKVRHKDSGKVRTVVGHFNQDECPGGFWVDTPIDGFMSWNVDAGFTVIR